MSRGVYTTLVAMFTAAPSMAGVSVLFGEENINAQDAALPFVCVVPTGGPYKPGTGYSQSQNINANSGGWMAQESLDLYMWAFDADLDNPELTNHADETLDLEERVLRAIQSQAANGLMFRPQNARWQAMQGAQNRYGRARVLTLQIDITFVDVTPPEATVGSITLTKELEI